MPIRKPKDSKTTPKIKQARKKSVAETKEIVAPPAKKRRRNAVSKECDTQSEPPRPKVPGSSKYNRRQRTYQITRESLRYDENAVDDLSMFDLPFLEGSTWGRIDSTPIAAVKKRRRAPAFNKLASFRGLQVFEENEGPPRPVIANVLGRTPILRVPLEVREEIYHYLLVSTRMILVRPDWVTVERSQLRNQALSLVCKQLSHESTSFMYRHNTFHTVLRSSSTQVMSIKDPLRIDASFLPLYRNIVIECPKPSWGLDWFDQVTQCVQRLCEAKPTLQSLTLVISPQRVGMTETALGRERAPVTFADFLWMEGRVMKAMLDLASHKIKIIVRLEGEKKVYETATWALEKGKWSEDDALIRQQRVERAVRVMDELKGWKARLEKDFMMNERRQALQVGKDLDFHENENENQNVSNRA